MRLIKFFRKMKVSHEDEFRQRRVRAALDESERRLKELAAERDSYTRHLQRNT